MMSLLENRLVPVTWECGFVEAPVLDVVKAFVKWQKPLKEARGVSVLSSHLDVNSLEQALQVLEPLSRGERTRFLFMGTDSHWTAFWDHWAGGTDASSRAGFLARHMEVRAMRVVNVPHTLKGRGREVQGQYGGTILEIHGPRPNPILNIERSIAAANDGGRWIFETSGDPLPFEEVERYQAKRKRDRFTPEMLDRYLRHLGVRAFDEDFYRPEEAYLVEFYGIETAPQYLYSLESLQREIFGPDGPPRQG